MQKAHSDLCNPSFDADAGQDALLMQIKSMTAYSKTPQPITQRKAQAKQAVFKKLWQDWGLRLFALLVLAQEKKIPMKRQAQKQQSQKRRFTKRKYKLLLDVHSDTTVPNAINIQEKAIMLDARMGSFVLCGSRK